MLAVMQILMIPMTVCRDRARAEGFAQARARLVESHGENVTQVSGIFILLSYGQRMWTVSHKPNQLNLSDREFQANLAPDLVLVGLMCLTILDWLA